MLDETKASSPYQKSCREKFNQYFIKSSKPKRDKYQKYETLSFLEKFFAWVESDVVPKTPKNPVSKLITQEFQLKTGELKNCKFTQWDVLKTDKLLDKESCDVFLFRNALYHLVCRGSEYLRIMKSDAAVTIENLAKQIHKVLKPGGLLVFGENEAKEGINKNVLFEILTKIGFEPVVNEKELSKLESELALMGLKKESAIKMVTNVWRKKQIL